MALISRKRKGKIQEKVEGLVQANFQIWLKFQEKGKGLVHERGISILAQIWKISKGITLFKISILALI